MHREITFFSYLFSDAISNSSSITSYKYWTGKVVEGSTHGLYWVTSQYWHGPPVLGLDLILKPTENKKGDYRCECCIWWCSYSKADTNNKKGRQNRWEISLVYTSITSNSVPYVNMPTCPHIQQRSCILHWLMHVHQYTWADWKVLRLLLFLFPGIRRGNTILGFVKVIQWRVWTCSWIAVAFSIWSQRVEAPSTFCYGGWGRHLCENTAEMCD